MSRCGSRSRARSGACAALVALALGAAPPTSEARDAGATRSAPVVKGAGEKPAESRAKREGFIVQPFVNTKKTRSLDHLSTALPAFVAERLSQHGKLRFVGGPGIFPKPGSAPPVGAKWIVEGEFERRADWRVAVTVRVKPASGEGAAQFAVRIGPKDEAARVGLETAIEAFAAAAGTRVPAAGETILAPFGRDPYAFVLYGRALATYAGFGPRARSADKAIEGFKRALVIDPKVPETRRFLGYVYLEEGMPGHARAQWTYALDLRPTYVAVLAGLAALDRTAGLPSARERYGRLVELEPDDLEARRSHGELLSEAGRLDEAQDELEKVLDAAPGDLRARRALALVLAARRAGAELVEELEELVKLDPEDLEARLDLAAAYLSINKPNEAEGVYDEILRRRPRHAAALKLVGDLARARGDVKKASTSYNKLRFLSPQDPRPVFLLGSAQYEAGDLEAAERMFTEGARYPGMLGDAYSNLGAIALRRGQPKEALWFLSRAAKRRPGKANVRFNYAVALYGAERHADALNELRAGQRLDPNDAELRFFTGVVALRLGLVAEAEQSFREALRLDPKHERARHNLSLLEPLVRPRREESVLLIEEGAPPPPPAPAARRQ